MDGKEEAKQSGPPSEDISRDDVRAQREAKKLAKAARKNKSLGKPTDPESVGEEKPSSQIQGKEAPVKQTGPKPPTKETPVKQTGPKTQAKETPAKQPGLKTQAKETPAKSQVKETPTKQSVPKPQAKETPGQKETRSSPKPADTTESAKKTEDKPAAPEIKPIEITQPLPTVDLQKSDSSSAIHALFRQKKGKEITKARAYKLHPLFYNIGVKVRNNVIRGANSRCVKLLEAIKDYVRCFDVPSGTTFKHGLFGDLEANMNCLRTTCPFSISMNNAVQFVLYYVHNMEDDDGIIVDYKNEILDMIDQYVEEKIEKAVEAIVLYGLEKINKGDKIMVYSITESLTSLVVKAAEEGIAYELILIQTPETIAELPDLLEKLKTPTSNQTVRVSIVNFSSALYKIRSCTKLLMGGHALFTNGGVMAQSGSGQLALLADTYNKPAIFLCETFKFCDRSPLDFFTLDEYMPQHSEIEDDLFEPKIMYDVTPSTLVTVVITDIDMLPSNSLAVVLRVQEGRNPKKQPGESQH
ncbi:Translation initiation factor eIF-2B subunit delta [Orchesella cincta]|uniref:Translation initiation factor eIF2B subunit delta n=1 Tax=Orchesella cincta TaxID=48709 RepID=A0A1D2MXI6_ORCCI|nr:Translation initiation factor eIF-2B subunit delta [Orchesella cincta]